MASPLPVRLEIIAGNGLSVGMFAIDTDHFSGQELIQQVGLIAVPPVLKLDIEQQGGVIHADNDSCGNVKTTKLSFGDNDFTVDSAALWSGFTHDGITEDGFVEKTGIMP